MNGDVHLAIKHDRQLRNVEDAEVVFLILKIACSKCQSSPDPNRGSDVKGRSDLAGIFDRQLIAESTTEVFKTEHSLTVNAPVGASVIRLNESRVPVLRLGFVEERWAGVEVATTPNEK